MGARRTVIVLGAVLAAAVAALANYAYLNSVQDRAYHNAQRLKIFVVSKDIPKGTPGEDALQQEYVKSGEIPREFRPGTAITDVATIRGKVAITQLSAGQVVVDGMFVDRSKAQITFAQRLKQGQVAITVQVDSVRGVAGLLVPGDLVNILVKDGPSERFLYQNVRVIAIGTSAAPSPGDTAAAVNPGSGLITFAVPPDAAAKIALAATSDLYLTLVPPDNEAKVIPPADPGGLFGGGLTPGGPS